MPGPFHGLKILDFCWVVIGPMTTRHFADFGATVVRVESSLRKDTIRSAAPFKDSKPGVNRSGYWSNYNGGKLSMSLNMSDPRARAVALELAQWADVVTENFTPGIMERWGLGYEDLKRVNPDVIMFSASMLGRGGPFEGQPGFGPVLTALSGHTHLTGWPDRAPVSPYGPYTDFLLPYLAVSSIIAALEHRDQTGQGQHLDLSQLEASLYFVAPAMLDYLANGRIQERAGNKDPVMAPHAVYPCTGEDRWCAIACQTENDWRALCSLMGKPELASDGSHFATMNLRKQNEDELNDLIGLWTVGLEASIVMKMCQDVGIAAGMVNDCRDLFEDPQLTHREHFVFMEHPEMGMYPSDSNCFLLSDSPAEYVRSALLGEHTEYVCREILGMDDSKISSFANEGVFD
jgi:benzylsuccinate CoA-transferase BbsF subunit